MAIAVRSFRHTNPYYGTSHVINVPNSPAPETGDVLLAFITIATQGFSGTPSGWELVNTLNQTRLLKRVATGSDSLTQVTTGGTYSQALMVAIQEADYDSVLRSSNWVAYNAGLATVSSPELTGYEGALVLRLAKVELQQASAIAPEDTTELYTQNTSGQGTYSCWYYRDTNLAASSSHPSRQWSGMATNKYKTADTIAIAPASSGESAIPAFIHHRRLLGVQ